MDLGIAGRRALVIGASRGLGFACAKALAAEGVSVFLGSRHSDALEHAAKRIRAGTGGDVAIVAADIGTQAGRTAILNACPDPDILVTNAGGPPSGDFRQFDLEDWSDALGTNFLSAVELIRATVDPMIARGWGRIVNVTSLTVRMPLPDFDLSTATRMALTGYVAGVARRVAPHGVTINNLLPGTIATERLRSLGQVSEALASRVPVGRVGEPDELGAACAFLCSSQAAYITGQNILVDGGLCPVTT